MLFRDQENKLKNPKGEFLYQDTIDKVTQMYIEKCRNFSEVCKVQRIVERALSFGESSWRGSDENLSAIGEDILKLLNELNAPQALKIAINERSAYEIETAIAQKDLDIILE